MGKTVGGYYRGVVYWSKYGNIHNFSSAPAVVTATKGFIFHTLELKTSTFTEFDLCIQQT